MTNVDMLEIQAVGNDYLLMKRGGMGLRVNFADNKEYTKEECAALFRGMEGKEAAIPADFNEPFFIALDFWRRAPDHSFRVIPFTFAVSTIELLAGDASRTLVICPVHRIQMRETDERDVPGVLFFYCPHVGCDRRYSRVTGHITIDDLPCRT